MKRNHLKRSHEKVAKTSISLPPRLYNYAEQRVHSLGHTGLSGYLQALIRKEMTSAS